MREVGYTSTKLHFANSWVCKPLKYTPLSVSESAHGHCLGALFSSAQLMAFAVFLLAVIKQRCITAGAPFWIGGELPLFVVRPHVPKQDVRTVTVRYEYMYHSTPTYHVWDVNLNCIYLQRYMMLHSSVCEDAAGSGAAQIHEWMFRSEVNFNGFPLFRE